MFVNDNFSLSNDQILDNESEVSNFRNTKSFCSYYYQRQLDTQKGIELFRSCSYLNGPRAYYMLLKHSVNRVGIDFNRK